MSVRTTASAFEPLADIRLRKRIDYPAGHSQEEQASGDRCELIDDMILGSERVISRTVEQTEDWNLHTLGPPRGCEQRTVLLAVVPMYRNPYLPPLSRMTNGDVLLRASCRSCQNDKERSGLLCRNTSPHTQQSNKETFSGVRRETERAMVLVLGRQTHDDRLHTVRNDTTTVSVEHPEKKMQKCGHDTLVRSSKSTKPGAIHRCPSFGRLSLLVVQDCWIDHTVSWPHL